MFGRPRQEFGREIEGRVIQHQMMRQKPGGLRSRRPPLTPGREMADGPLDRGLAADEAPAAGPIHDIDMNIHLEDASPP